MTNDAWRTDIIIGENASLLDAMSMLDRNAQKVLFIVDDRNKLQAALTDGDIRRWILAKGNLEATVKEFANYSPKYLLENQRHTAKQFMLEKHIEVVPIVNSELIIVGVERTFELRRQQKMQLESIPVVINAGGLGTRLYPYTKILPKPLIPIGDLPIIQHIVNSFRDYGCKEFYVIVNHKKNMIKAYFNETENDYAVCFVDEDTPLGTGGGVGLLKGLVDRTFFFTNCDILINEDIEKIYQQHVGSQNTITMVCSLKDYVIPYGTVRIGSDGQIEEMTEKPHFSFFVNTGLYIVEPCVIEELEPNTKISFPDLAQRYIDRKCRVGVFPVSENAWMDMGQFDGMDDMIERISKLRK